MSEVPRRRCPDIGSGGDDGLSRGYPQFLRSSCAQSLSRYTQPASPPSRQQRKWQYAAPLVNCHRRPPVRDPEVGGGPRCCLRPLVHSLYTRSLVHPMLRFAQSLRIAVQRSSIDALAICSVASPGYSQKPRCSRQRCVNSLPLPLPSRGFPSNNSTARTSYDEGNLVVDAGMHRRLTLSVLPEHLESALLRRAGHFYRSKAATSTGDLGIGRSW